MKRSLIALALFGALMFLGLPARTHALADIVDEDTLVNQYSYNDEYDETQSHPLRIAAYLAHPVGYALEWIIFRPFHAFISLPGVAEVTGHHPHGTKLVY